MLSCDSLLPYIIFRGKHVIGGIVLYKQNFYFKLRFKNPYCSKPLFDIVHDWDGGIY